MRTRELATEYRLTQWAGIMRERTESGLSIKDFCSAAGFHENVYYYWQRKLREAACEGISANSGGEANDHPVPQGWAICASAESAGKLGTVTVEIGGCRVHVSTDTDPELLARVCRTLKSLC